MTEVQLTMNLVPVGKGRPRMSTRGGFARAYTPAKTAHFERSVAALLRNHLGAIDPFVDGVDVELEFYFPRPKRPTHPFPSAFDLDNLIKATCDAANKIVWKDDNLIRKITASKQYGEPRIEFRAVKSVMEIQRPGGRSDDEDQKKTREGSKR